MNNNIHHPLLPDDPCLSEDQLLAYLDDRLTPLQRHEAEKHMLDCGFCSDALEGMALVAEHRRAAVIIPLHQKTAAEVPAQAGKSDPKVIYLRPRFWMATAASIALLFGTLWVLNNGPQGTNPNGMAQVTAMSGTPSADSQNQNAKTDTNTPRTSDRIITLYDTVHLNPAPAPVEEHNGVKNATAYKDVVSPGALTTVANGGTSSYWTADSTRTIQNLRESEKTTTLAKADAENVLSENLTSFDAITTDSDQSVATSPESAGRKEERDSKTKRHDAHSKTAATAANDYYSKSETAKPASEDKYRSVADTTTLVLQKKTDVAEDQLKVFTPATTTTVTGTSSAPVVNGSTNAGGLYDNTGDAYTTGMAYLQKQQYTNAITQFDIVLKSKSNAHYQDARYQKAKALAAAGRKAEAKALLQNIAGEEGKYKAAAANDLKTY